MVIAEEREEGVLLRPVVALPIEIYSPERKAEFLLNSAIAKEDYLWAVKEVRKMGIDPRDYFSDPILIPTLRDSGSVLHIEACSSVGLNLTFSI